MAYIRKTKDRFDVLTLKDHEWYFLCSKYTEEEAILAAHEYRDKTGSAAGIVKYREKLEERQNEHNRHYLDHYKLDIYRLYYALYAR